MLRPLDPRLLPQPSEGEYVAGPLGFELAGKAYAPGDVVPVWDHLQTQHIFAEVGQGRLEIRRFPATVAHLRSLVEEDDRQLQAIQAALGKAKAEAEAFAETLEALSAGLLGLADTIKATRAGAPIGAQIEALAADTKASAEGVKKSTRRKARASKASKS